jgi:hypothetical protein
MSKLNICTKRLQRAAVIEIQIKAVATKSHQHPIGLFCCNRSNMCLGDIMRLPRSFRIISQL